MLHAIIHGKVSSKVKNQEDVLTSCVFGMLDILPARLGLGPWLQEAKNLAGESHQIDADALDCCGPTFWPRFPLGMKAVEPDVLFDLRDSVLVVEAKYGSGPSGWPTEKQGMLGGQLSRQWVAVANSDLYRGRPLSLVYLTAGWMMPIEEMEAMIAEVEREDLASAFRSNLYWLSWRMLSSPGVLVSSSQEPRHQRVLDDLRAYLRAADLGMFGGSITPGVIVAPPWVYGYGAPPASATIEWRYTS